MDPEGDSCPSEDHILDNAIEYKLSGTYPPSLRIEEKSRNKCLNIMYELLATHNAHLYGKLRAHRGKKEVSYRLVCSLLAPFFGSLYLTPGRRSYTHAT